MLLEAAEAAARALGARRVRMTVVNVREGLIAWYERRGYRPTGEVLPFPYDDLRFGQPTRPRPELRGAGAGSRLVCGERRSSSRQAAAQGNAGGCHG
ncbi:MAG: hypothetical protein WDN45_05495 [Caulobacteraceae bacterium]